MVYVGGNTSGRYGPGRNESRKCFLKPSWVIVAVKLPNGGDETLELSLCRCHSGCGSVALGCGFEAIVHVSWSLSHSVLAADCAALPIRSAINTAVFGLTSRMRQSSLDATLRRLELNRQIARSHLCIRHMAQFKKCADFDGKRLPTAVALVSTEARAGACHLSDSGATALGTYRAVRPDLVLHATVSFCLIPKVQRLSSVQNYSILALRREIVRSFILRSQPTQGGFILVGRAGGC